MSPGSPGAVQCAAADGADGGIELTWDVTVIGLLVPLEPAASLLITVIWYVVSGWSGPMSPLLADPLTVPVRTGAVEATGVAVMVEELTRTEVDDAGVQPTWN
jgi:hypothetical protein